MGESLRLFAESRIGGGKENNRQMYGQMMMMMRWPKEANKTIKVETNPFSLFLPLYREVADILPEASIVRP